MENQIGLKTKYSNSNKGIVQSTAKPNFSFRFEEVQNKKKPE